VTCDMMLKGAFCFCMFLQTRSEFTLCRLYTQSGCPRQFDRRPSAAAAVGGGSENPTAAAALANGEEMGRKRKRAPPSDDDTTSSDGDGSTQQILRQRGTDSEGLNDDMAYWSEFLDYDWL
jgi:hypothetical protein